MLGASILIASAVAVWLGWRVEESRRLDREAAIRLAEIDRAVQMERTERKWSARELISRHKYNSLTNGSAPSVPIGVEVAQIQANAARDVARIQFPESPPIKPALREVQLPDDLEAHVMSWNDEFARDDERGNLRRLYLEFQDGDEKSTWAKVRRAARIAELGDA